MIKLRLSIQLLEVSGFATAIRAVHLPMGKDPVYYPKAGCDIHPAMKDGDPIQFINQSLVNIDPKEIQLLSRLVKAGDEHALSLIHI